MALSRVKTWVKEVLTFADLNAEFNNILNNPISLISPATGDIDLDGNALIMDGDADSQIAMSTNDQLSITLGGSLIYTISSTIFDFNAKRLDLDADNDTSIRADSDDIITMETAGIDTFIFDGTTASTVGGLSFTSAAEAGDVAILAQGTGTDLGISVTSKGAGNIKLVPGSTGVVEIDGSTLAGKCLNGSVAYDPVSVPAGDTVSKSVTVTGAALGDFAMGAFSLTLGGMLQMAWVTAADTVDVSFYNPTGGAIDLGAGTLYARVFTRT